jgi:hypothetical protein
MARTLVEVRPAVNRRDWHAFMELPARLFADDPMWIEPLRRERAALWSHDHPWFQHAHAQLFLAWRGDRVVGSISAQRDDLYERQWGVPVGYFGQFDAEDDPAVFRALLDAAAGWLREHRCSLMQGPYDLGVNQSCGLLVEGFDAPPMMLMGHARPYYAQRLHEAGLETAMDLHAYLLAPDFAVPRLMARVTGDLKERARFRPIDRRRYWQDLETLRDIFNDAWAHNWGFVPFTEAEFRHMGRSLKPLLRPDYIQIAEVDGEAAGFIVALPNVNELIRDLHGRLLPFGWARLLWRLTRKQATTARVPLMGIRQRYQSSPLGAGLALGLIDRLRAPMQADGIRNVELSWILETNQRMRSLLAMLGAQAYKRYRIFQQDLTGG